MYMLAGGNAIPQIMNPILRISTDNGKSFGEIILSVR